MKTRQMFREGVRLFNEGKYFECHDIFEEIWMNEVGSNAEFFRALIHIAVGSYHLQNRNYRGAKSQLLKGVQKLNPYSPQYFSIKISGLMTSLQSIILDVERIVQGQLSHSDLPELPMIELVDDG